MEIFGIIMTVLLIVFALGIIGVYVTPFIVVEARTLKYRIQKGLADKKADIDKRSDERRNRDERRREKDFELANKKLDAKLSKLDKQIKIYDEKQTLAKELKKAAVSQKAELNKSKSSKTDKVVDTDELAIPEMAD